MREKCLRWVKDNPHCLVLSYFIVYVVWFFGLEFLAEPKYWIDCPWDQYIPFCEYFIVPYGLWFPYFIGALAFFLLKNKEIFLKLCFVMFTGMTICLLIYTVAPNAIDLRQEIIGDNIFCRMAGLIRAVDTPTNVCPSIHVSSTLAVHWAICRYPAWKRPRLTRMLSLILAFSICASTVFLKQHSIIDVVWGFVLTLTLVLMVKLYEKRRRILPPVA